MRTSILVPVLLSSDAVNPAVVYSTAVLATSPIAYWKHSEGTGTAIVDSSTNALTNGVYQGVTWNATGSRYSDACPSHDGSGDYANIHSAALASVINLNEGCLLMWAKMAESSVWTDGTNRQFFLFNINGSNSIIIFKSSTNNTIDYRRTGNATTKSQTVGSLSYTGWFSLLLSWSVASDHLKLYINGSQAGTTQTGNVAMAAGSLALAVIGAASLTPTNVFNGFYDDFILWNTPITGGGDARLALGVPA